MPRLSSTKIGNVYIKRRRSGRWRACWVDPLTKRYVRRLLPATGFKEAQKQARVIHQELAAGRGFSPRQRGTVGHSINQAVLEAVKHSDANERTRRNYLSRFNGFAVYLNEHCQGVEAWSEVSEQILANYVAHCRRAGLAHDSIRLRLYVLRLTSAYMARTYPGRYRHVTTALRLRRLDPPQAERETCEAILQPEELRALLAWLKEHEPMVHCWAVLQGLCGLRLLEAAYLREQDIDPARGVITITETSAHKPKNRPSWRTIPVCPAVAQALVAWTRGLKVRHPEGYLFFPARARATRSQAMLREVQAGALTMDRICHYWAAALLGARKAGLALPVRFTPRRLRATFVTAMRRIGADFTVLQSYIGHAPSTVLAAHYDKIDGERLAVITALAQQLYEGKGTYANPLPQEKAHIPIPLTLS